jgi:hypothetical protein
MTSSLSSSCFHLSLVLLSLLGNALWGNTSSVLSGTILLKVVSLSRRMVLLPYGIQGSAWGAWSLSLVKQRWGRGGNLSLVVGRWRLLRLCSVGGGWRVELCRALLVSFPVPISSSGTISLTQQGFIWGTGQILLGMMLVTELLASPHMAAKGIARGRAFREEVWLNWSLVTLLLLLVGRLL